MNIFQRFLSWIISHFKKPEKPKPSPKICTLEGCGNELMLMDAKKCKYCDKHFCGKHIYPAELHKCKGNPTVIPRSMKRNIYKR